MVSEKSPKRELANNVNFGSGGNDFDAAMEEAYERIACSRYDQYIYYFMSDGVWDFSDGPINLFRNNNEVKGKLTYYSVGFGSGADLNVLQ